MPLYWTFADANDKDIPRFGLLQAAAQWYCQRHGMATSAPDDANWNDDELVAISLLDNAASSAQNGKESVIAWIARHTDQRYVECTEILRHLSEQHGLAMFHAFRV